MEESSNPITIIRKTNYKPSGTILQRLKYQLKMQGYDVSNVKTISQALRKLDSSVTGGTISECLDDVYVAPMNQSDGN